MFQLTF